MLNTELSKLFVVMLFMHIVLSELTIYVAYFKHFVPFYNATAVNLGLCCLIAFFVWMKEKSLKLDMFDIPLCIVMGILLFIFIDGLNIVIDGAGAVTYFIFVLKMFAVIMLVVALSTIQQASSIAEGIVRSYCYLCLYIAITGILGFLLFVFNLVDVADWLPSEAILRKAGEGDGDKSLYSFPYYLTLILIGDNSYSVAGFSFIRFSGISIEPSVAAFLMAPSLFLVHFITDRYKKWIYAVLGFNILLYASLTSIMVLVAIGILATVKQLIRGKGWGMTTCVLVMCLPVLLMMPTLSLLDGGDTGGLGIKQKLTGSSAATSVRMHTEKLQSEQVLGGAYFAYRESDKAFFDVAQSSSLLLYVGYYCLTLVILSLLTFRYLSIESAYIRSYLSAIYVIVHAMKFPMHAPFVASYYLFVLLPYLVEKYQGRTQAIPSKRFEGLESA